MRTSAFLTLAVLLMLGAPCFAGDMKVGFVYVSPVGDAGYSYAHDQGRLAVEAMDGVSTSFVESVAEGQDSKRVILNMTRKGYSVCGKILTYGSQNRLIYNIGVLVMPKRRIKLPRRIHPEQSIEAGFVQVYKPRRFFKF